MLGKILSWGRVQIKLTRLVLRHAVLSRKSKCVFLVGYVYQPSYVGWCSGRVEVRIENNAQVENNAQLLRHLVCDILVYRAAVKNCYMLAE